MSDRNQPVRQLCPVCGNPGALWHPPLGYREDIDCPSCGKIRLTGSAEPKLQFAKAHGLDVTALSRKLRAHPRRDDDRLFVSDELLEQLGVRGA